MSSLPSTISFRRTNTLIVRGDALVELWNEAKGYIEMKEFRIDVSNTKSDDDIKSIIKVGVNDNGFGAMRIISAECRTWRAYAPIPSKDVDNIVIPEVLVPDEDYIIEL